MQHQSPKYPRMTDETTEMIEKDDKPQKDINQRVTILRTSLVCQLLLALEKCGSQENLARVMKYVLPQQVLRPGSWSDSSTLAGVKFMR